MRSWDSVVEYLNKAEQNLWDPAPIQQNGINTYVACDDHQNSQLQVQIELLAYT